MLALLGGILIVAAIIGTILAGLYLAWWLVLLAIRRIPMIGRRHRHSAWERLNRP